MKKLSDIRLEELKKLDDRPNQTWYTQKHTFKFAELCYIARILELWNNNPEISYGEFFELKKHEEPFKSNIGSSRNYRSTFNLIYYGLSTGGYKTESLTSVYYLIKHLTNCDFSNTSLYQNIIDRQLEKITTNSQFVHMPTFMFTLKVILILGDVTGEYKISAEEITRILATSRTWKEYFEVVETILRFRNDNDYKRKYLADSKNITADIRFTQILDNYSLIEESDGWYIIPSENIKKIRKKVSDFELQELYNLEDSNFGNQIYSTWEDTKQEIYFGAPGVGKSHNLKSVFQNEDDVIRITFHPETDYAAFVGCYKPQTRIDESNNSTEIIYNFQGQAFTEAYVEAWKRYFLEVPRKDFFLVIEEINRGNCAQIFGDIFQLLDRDDEGFSDYSIKPDKDLALYLSEQFETLDLADKLNKLNQGLGNGEKMILPPNLHIIATMNTSDQSLFPIDSAFKRRWDWVYMPIETNPKDKDGNLVTRTIETKEFKYDWGQFLEKVNKRIFKTTESEDKQLGFWFVKPKSGDTTIYANDFVSKVIFFLWNDIYKDFGDDAFSIFNFAPDGNPESKEKERHSFKDFTSGFKSVNDNLVDAFLKNLEVDAKAKVQPVSSNSENSDENSN